MHLLKLLKYIEIVFISLVTGCLEIGKRRRILHRKLLFVHMLISISFNQDMKVFDLAFSDSDKLMYR